VTRIPSLSYPIKALKNPINSNFQLGEYPKAIERFRNATNMHGYQSDLAYSLALCHYQLGETEQTMRFIGEIVERGVKDHPGICCLFSLELSYYFLELSVGMVSEGIDVRSVGNTLLLNETALIEALNLKFAIEYRAKNMDNAMVCLSDMPPRSEEELDPVTLHNQALMNVNTNLADSFAKLQYLLTQWVFEFGI
jgi:tetratricopeptide repeat protein 30